MNDIKRNITAQLHTISKDILLIMENLLDTFDK